MILEFKRDRIAKILHLKDMTQIMLSAKMCDISGRKARYGIEKWMSGLTQYPPVEHIEIMAKALEIPVAFFYYQTVEISMNIDSMVTIYIPDTKESVTFKFM